MVSFIQTHYFFTKNIELIRYIFNFKFDLESSTFVLIIKSTMKKLFKKNMVVKTLKATAGFPSPAENYIEERLNLNKYLIKNEEATFFMRVSGDSMINIGIFNNDILVVDKGIKPVNSSIIVAALNGELVIKKFFKDYKSGFHFLKSENSNYPDIKLKSDFDLEVWGVATYVIHSLG